MQHHLDQGILAKDANKRNMGHQVDECLHLGLEERPWIVRVEPHNKLKDHLPIIKLIKNKTLKKYILVLARNQPNE